MPRERRFGSIKEVRQSSRHVSCSYNSRLITAAEQKIVHPGINIGNGLQYEEFMIAGSPSETSTGSGIPREKQKLSNQEAKKDACLCS